MKEIIVLDTKMKDSDSDQLTDVVEKNKYHTNPTIADTDGDGWKDSTEAEFGSLPLYDAILPTFQPRAIVEWEDAQAKSLELRFPGSYGSRYSIQGSVDMTEWTTFEIGIIGDGGTVSRTYPGGDGKIRFYRVMRN